MSQNYNNPDDLSQFAAPAPVAGDAVQRVIDAIQFDDHGTQVDVIGPHVRARIEAALAQDRASQAAEVDALRTELAALKGDTSGFSGANSDDLHVDHFAAAMKGKLTLARSKGRSGWEDREDCPQQRLSDMLRAHVEKGDPIDVANFAMFLHQRGESILASQAGAAVDTSTNEAWIARAESKLATQPPAVGVDVSDEMVERAFRKSKSGGYETEREQMRAALHAALRTGGGA